MTNAPGYMLPLDSSSKLDTSKLKFVVENTKDGVMTSLTLTNAVNFSQRTPEHRWDATTSFNSLIITNKDTLKGMLADFGIAGGDLTLMLTGLTNPAVYHDSLFTIVYSFDDETTRASR